MDYLDKERYSSAPVAAMAAWNAMIVALHDEELLKEQYRDVTDNDLDFSDWNTAYYAYMALSGARQMPWSSSVECCCSPV